MAATYQVKTQKGIFPYMFTTLGNLFYVGNTPAKSYYKSDVKQSEYDKMFTCKWSFIDETIKYLKDDLDALHEVITRAKKQVFLYYKINMIDSSTIFGLALRIY